MFDEFWIGVLATLVAVTTVAALQAWPEVLRWSAPGARLYPADIACIPLCAACAVHLLRSGSFLSGTIALGMLCATVAFAVALYEKTLKIRDKELDPWTHPTDRSS
jgi:hypothetical protein